jgi:hypothetical protein
MKRAFFKIAVKPGEVPSGVPSSFFSDPSGRVIFYKANQHYRYQGRKICPLAIEGIPADMLSRLNRP